MMGEQPKYEFRRPRSSADWRAYNEIRRVSLFEERGRHGVYDSKHPDEFKDGNHPFLLFFGHMPIATVRIDLVDGKRAIMRLVAVHRQYRGGGHGRVLLHYAEDFARAKGCLEAVSNAAKESLDFYERLGYVEQVWDRNEKPRNAVQVVKALSLPST